MFGLVVRCSTGVIHSDDMKRCLFSGFPGIHGHSQKAHGTKEHYATTHPALSSELSNHPGG